MRWMIAAVLVASTACQEAPSKQAATQPVKTADDCKLFLAKARGTLQRLATAASVTWTPAMEEDTLTQCRADLAAGQRAKLIDCVLTAKDEAAVQRCFPRYEELVDKRP
ncbi:MAG TPA: hypothetical protein VM513_09135 [Kofleriaceae bacterium]|jgi:hypothetical protein|nr:hypothetical protein [Kofleriaceae bacterium]